MRLDSTRPAPLWLVTVLAATLAVAACLGDEEAKSIAAARASLEKKDVEAARLRLKSLLQSKPESGEARFLLGKLMHDNLEMPAAEAELRRALEAGYATDKLLPVLADTLLALGKGKLLLVQYGKTTLPDAQDDAALKTALATAQAAEGDLAAASSLLDQALQRVADHPDALLLRAKLAASGGDKPGALSQVTALLQRLPTLAPAWAFKGDLLQLLQPDEPGAAIAAWRESAKLDPRSPAVQSALIAALISTQDFDAAQAQWLVMKKALPMHPQTLKLEAQLAFQRGDARRSRDLALQLLRAAPDDPRLLLAAGQAELKLGNLAQAENQLSRSLQFAPKASAPRRLLAEVQLRSGQTDKALATLKPLLDAKQPEAAALALAARVQLTKGDFKAAEANFNRAAKLDPGNPRLQAAVAISRVANGQESAGFDALQKLSGADKGTAIDLALINTRLQRNDLPGALKAVDGLSAKQPDDPLPDQLRGRIALQRKDSAAARKHFEAALGKSPDYLPALASLAALDLAAKLPDAARARYLAAVQRNPRLGGALLALAELNSRSNGKPEETASWLAQAVTADPTDAWPRLLLIEHHLSTGDTKAALLAAQAGVAALPDNAELLDRLGRAHLTSGDTQQAISAFNKLAALQPKSALPQLRLADAQSAAKQPSAAAAAVRRAMAIEPESPLAQQAAAKLALNEHKPAVALSIARKLQATQAADPMGFMLEGEIEMRQRHWDTAAVAFRKALDKPRPEAAAQRLYAALLAGKKPDEAEKLATDWLKRHPEDMGFVLYLGDMALAGKQPDQAEVHYRKVLASQPQQVIAQNNLAYVLAVQRKPGAVALAEQALKQYPNSPGLMDTLALGLAAEQQLPRALEVQTKVVQMQPDVPKYRLQLAKLQLQAGRKPAALAELGKLAKLGQAYPQQAEVAELLRSMGS